MNPSPQQIWKYNQVIYTELIDELDKHFKAINVRYMPIKGAYLICSGLAAKMLYRRMDDIDILVQKEDFNRVCDYFTKVPQVTFLKHKWYFEKEFSYSIGTFQCFFEIHWLLNYPARFSLPTENLFNRARLSRGMQILPCPEDALLVLICHALVHISYEIRETLFEEMKLVSGQKYFSWNHFWSLAKTTGIMSFVSFILLWYKNEIHDEKVIIKNKYFYIWFLAKALPVKWYRYVPFLFKRAIEILFTNKSLWLIRNKLCK